MKDFKKLLIWSRGMEITKAVYGLVDQLPAKEGFLLRNQILRSATSISANIAEGASRKSPKEFLRFLEISLGSSFELETQMRIIGSVYKNLSAEADKVLDLLDEEQKMVRSFMNSVSQKARGSKLGTPN